MKFKKFMATLISVAMIISCVNLTAFAESTTTGITTAEALAAALKTGGDIKLGGDITLNETAEVPSGVTATLDLNEKKIEAGNYYIENKGTLTIKNGTLVSTESANDTNGAPLYNHGGTLTVESGTYTGVIVAMRVEGGTATINNGTFSVTSIEGKSNHLIRMKGDTLTINGGTFNANNADNGGEGCTIMSATAGTTVINGGTFTGFAGASMFGDGTGVTVKGGTFKPHNSDGFTIQQCLEGYLADGYFVNADGVVKKAVAQIGANKYGTLAEAITAANSMTGDVTVEIYSKAEYTDTTASLTGAYDSINFVGKTSDAEIYIARNGTNGYISGEGNDCAVSFKDLILSKAAGAFAYDAGFMNVAFSVYRVGSVSYTNCTFTNGACAAGCPTTYTGCTFNKSHEKYAVWAYGSSDIVIDSCVFDDDRGIKMFAEGAAKTTGLTVKNSDFSKLTGKPAIVLTYGESVTLEGNTYSSTGVFELDKDGAPNGTTVTADITDIACMNDSYADCGVLVDGKIYTTVTDAAEVATEGSTVTLMYNTTETVELAEGVTLNKNGYTAENVTVAKPDPAGDITTGYVTADYNKTGKSGIFGQADGVVGTESFEVKLYYGETLVGTAALVDTNKVLLNGESRSISWHILANEEDDDSWWDTEWITPLNVNAIPDKVELYVDGKLVDTGVIELNNTDLSYPICAAVTDADGKIQSFVAGTGHLNSTHSYDDALETAFANGGNITMLRDVKLTELIKVTNATLTLNGNGHSISGTGALWLENGTYDVRNVVFENINYNTNYGILEFVNAAAKVTGCTFKDNNAVNCIAVDCNTNSGTSDVTIDGCTISGNTCSSAVINIAMGKVAVKDSKITDNTANIAVIYNSANCTVTDNKFGDVTLTGTKGNEAVILTGPWVEGNYAISITENAFLKDTYPAVYVENWAEEYNAVSTNDLSSNYWHDGDKPVAGTDYKTKNDPNVTLDSYYKKYAESEDGFTLSDLATTSVAAIGDTEYPSLAKAVEEANADDTITLLDSTTESSIININENVTIDLANKTVTVPQIMIKSGAKVEIKNGSVVGSSTGSDTIRSEGGNLTLTNVNASGLRHTVRIVSGTATINGGEYTYGGNTTVYKTLHVINVGDDENPTTNIADVTINDGTFIAGKPYTADGGCAVKVQKGSSVTINGGNFSNGVLSTLDADDGATISVTGGTFDEKVPENYIADGYAALADLNGNYVVGTKPTATANNLGVMSIPAGEWKDMSFNAGTTDMPLSFVMEFIADETAEAGAVSPYADWYADFVITVTGLENGAFDTTGCYLAGHYGSFGWIKVPLEGILNTVEEDVRYPVMLGVGMGQKYDYICSGVENFKCAMYLTPEVLEQNPNINVNLELCLVDNSQGSDAATSAIQTNTNCYTVEDHTYVAEDFVLNYVAKDESGKQYLSLADAVAAAEAGDTITLLKDAELDTTLRINGVTLDGQGYSITPSETYASDTNVFVYRDYRGGVLSGDLTLKNVTIDAKGKAQAVRNDYGGPSTFYMDNVTVTGGYRTDFASGVHISGGSSNAVITNCTFTDNTGATDISELGTADNYWAANDLWVGGNTTVTVTDSTIGGIFVNDTGSGNPGLLTVNETEEGKTNITYLATEYTSSTDTKAKAVITGGSVDTLYNAGTLEISGGTFKTEIQSEWCADGFTPVDNGDGTYGVKEADLLDTDTSFIRNILATNDAGDARYHVILFCGIDSLRYKEVGFEVTVDGKTQSQGTNTVYTSYTAAGETLLPNRWGDNCKYICGLTVSFPTDLKDKSVTFRPYVINFDGSTTYGKYKTFTGIYTK